MKHGLFVTGTTTGAGKTTVTAALARELRARGRRVAAIKPIETGVLASPNDAVLLAAACGMPELAHDPGWYRAQLPASPYAATLEGEAPVDLDRICERVATIDTEVVLCEGAGGLLVPLDRHRTIADFASRLALPLLVVAPDRLGVLSDVLTTVAAAHTRGLTIAAVALSRTTGELDPSSRTNGRILKERLDAQVVTVDHDGPVTLLIETLAPYLL